MKYVDLQNEIHELQAQLDSITQQEQECVQAQDNASSIEGILESQSPKELIKKLKKQLRKSGEGLEINEQLQDLVFELEEQLDQLPPKACLLVFSAGVVFGRVLN